MGRHQDNAAVQQQASRAVWNLAANHIEHKVKIASLGGIEAILKGMGRHRDNATVQQQGSEALLQIGSNTD